MAGHPILAALHDRMPAGAERAGLSERRATVISEASGQTLEPAGIEADRMPRGGFLVSPAIRGTARPPTG